MREKPTFFREKIIKIISFDSKNFIEFIDIIFKRFFWDFKISILKINFWSSDFWLKNLGKIAIIYGLIF